jgi:hypothetical protein
MFSPLQGKAPFVAVAAMSAALFSGGLLHAAQQNMPVPATDDETGFELIFDGKTMNGWEGDPKYWRVENGVLVGEVLPTNIPTQNTFFIWRGGVPRDFDLKVEYRISAKGNSGLNYRSVEVPGVSLALQGYQADLDGENRNANNVRYTGQNYEERGRAFLALRGQMTHIVEGKPPQIIGSVGDAKEIESVIKNGDWNELRIIARGNIMIELINQRVTNIVIDDDPKGRKLEGLLGVQVHVGGAMKIEYRNFRLKKLDALPASASETAPPAASSTPAASSATTAPASSAVSIAPSSATPARAP